MPIGWLLDSVPELVIGNGDSAHQNLYKVQGVRGFPDGRMVVVDGGSQELRFFDPKGHLLDRIGGGGEGPGEFRNPVLVSSVSTDSLLLWDSRLPRVQVFSGDGQDHRSIRMSNGWPFGSRRSPLGAVGARLLLRAPLETEREIMTAPEGPRGWTYRYFWYDPTTGQETFIDSFRVEPKLFRDSEGTSDIPFAPSPTATSGQFGALITPGGTAEIREYDLDSRLRRVFRVDEGRRPRTREDMDARIEAAMTLYPNANRDLWERSWRSLPMPDSLPTFASIQVDQVGWIWAELYSPWADLAAGWRMRFGGEPPVEKEWMLFDPEGRARGTIETPAGVRILSIGEAFILGLWVDDFGVEYVHRYRLRRAGPALDGIQDG